MLLSIGKESTKDTTELLLSLEKKVMADLVLLAESMKEVEPTEEEVFTEAVDMVAMKVDMVAMKNVRV